VQFTNQVTESTIRPPDAAFRHGLGDWPDTQNLYLFGNDHVPMAAPALVRAAELQSVADVARITLLQHFQTPALSKNFARRADIWVSCRAGWCNMASCLW